MNVIELNEDNFKKEVIDNKEKVLVDFNADWCGPCRMLAPILEEIGKEKDIKIVSVNVDDNETLAREYNVFSIPCLVLIKDGKEINRSVGLISKQELIEFINN